MAKKEENELRELVYIQTRLKAPKSQRNSFGGYNYRSCEDIMEAVKPLLAETNCSLTVSDDIVQVSDRIYVKATATLRTPNGEEYKNTAYAREPLSKKGSDESQVTGAASSYARKYALNGLFCIDDTKDADALNTTQPETKKPAQAPKADLFNDELDEAFQLIKPNIESAPSKQYLKDLHAKNPGLHDYKPFKDAMNKRFKEVT